MPELTVFSRPGCHLCERLIEELEPRCRAAGVSVRVLDVDSDRRWRDRYGLRVPVVVAGERELSGWPLDRGALDAWLGDLGETRSVPHSPARRD